MGDLDEIDPIVRENLTFIPCRKAGEVLTAALVLPEAKASVKAAATDTPEVMMTPEVTVRPTTTL
jgi:hypothetical protein